MSLYELASRTPTEMTVQWSRNAQDVVVVRACGLTAYLAELLAVPHSAFWDYVREAILCRTATK